MKLLILYGTLTMNTETVAQAIFEELSGNPDLEVEIKNMVEVITSAELEEFDCFILGTSTWGEAEYPPDTEDFMNVITTNPPNLVGKKAAFFGLGETAYENFCSSIKIVREYFLNDLKTVELGELKLIDGYPDDLILDDTKEWAKDAVKELTAPIL